LYSYDGLCAFRTAGEFTGLFLIHVLLLDRWNCWNMIDLEELQSAGAALSAGEVPSDCVSCNRRFDAAGEEMAGTA
jgi:hypothetical protein